MAEKKTEGAGEVAEEGAGGKNDVTKEEPKAKYNPDAELPAIPNDNSPEAQEIKWLHKMKS